jgi:hypothetical protein
LKFGGGTRDLSNHEFPEPEGFTVCDPVCEEINITTMVRSVKEAAASWNMDLGRNIFKRVTMVCEAAVFSKRVNLKQMQLGAYLAAGVASPSTCISRAGLLRGTALPAPYPTGYGLA